MLMIFLFSLIFGINAVAADQCRSDNECALLMISCGFLKALLKSELPKGAVRLADRDIYFAEQAAVDPCMHIVPSVIPDSAIAKCRQKCCVLVKD